MCSHRRVHSSAKKTPIILSGTGAKAHFFTPLFNFRWDSQVGSERRYEVGDGGGGVGGEGELMWRGDEWQTFRVTEKAWHRSKIVCKAGDAVETRVMTVDLLVVT